MKGFALIKSRVNLNRVNKGIALISAIKVVDCVNHLEYNKRFIVLRLSKINRILSSKHSFYSRYFEIRNPKIRKSIMKKSISSTRINSLLNSSSSLARRKWLDHIKWTVSPPALLQYSECLNLLGKFILDYTRNHSNYIYKLCLLIFMGCMLGKSTWLEESINRC